MYTVHALRPAVVLLLCLSLAACQRGGGGASPSEESYPQIILSEIFRIGDEAAGDTVVFGRIDGMAVNAAGQLFVGDESSMDISVFSAGGVLIGTLGSRGVAPGEFRDISNVLVGRNDSIYVFDVRQGLSVFAPETWLFQRRIKIVRNDSAGYAMSVIGITDMGPITLHGFSIGVDNLDADRFRVAALTSWAGTMVRILARLHDRQLLLFMSPEQTPALRYVPFGRRPTFSFGPSGKLYSGWNETIDIAITSVDGEALGAVRKNHVPIPVTTTEFDAIINPSAFGSIHEVKPAYKTFIVDDKDQVWIKGESQGEMPTAEWLILNAAGKVVGRTELPTNLTLEAVRSGRAYGSIESASVFDPAPVVPTVVVYSVDM